MSGRFRAWRRCIVDSDVALIALGLTAQWAGLLWWLRPHNATATALWTASGLLAMALAVRLTRWARVPVRGAGLSMSVPAEHAVALASAVEGLQSRLAQQVTSTRERRLQSLETDAQNTAFLRAVSHELRTPLNAILGFADILLAGLEGDLNGEQRENLGVIRESGQRLLELFNDSIELSAMASGQLSLRRERVLVGDLLAEAVQVLEEARGMRPVHVHTDCADDCLHVSAQRDRLLRVLVTLGQYGLSRTEAGAVGLLAETSSAAGPDALDKVLRITLVDGGAAQDAATLRDWVRPERAAEAGAAGTRGQTLRLAIAKQLVELHGGRWEFVADQPGRSFAVALPVEARPPAGESPDSAPAVVP